MMDYRELYSQDKKSILAVMLTNIADDLTKGDYSMNGKSVISGILDALEYAREKGSIIDLLNTMEEKEANKKAYALLKRDGAI